MISKFLSKLKSILFKSAVTPETPLKKEKKAEFYRLEDEILELLEEQIIKTLYYYEGYYDFSLKNNMNIKKAKSILNSPEHYFSILKKYE